MDFLVHMAEDLPIGFRCVRRCLVSCLGEDKILPFRACVTALLADFARIAFGGGHRMRSGRRAPHLVARVRIGQLLLSNCLSFFCNPQCPHHQCDF
jgi:hypothetical protein